MVLKTTCSKVARALLCGRPMNASTLDNLAGALVPPCRTKLARFIGWMTNTFGAEHTMEHALRGGRIRGLPAQPRPAWSGASAIPYAEHLVRCFGATARFWLLAGPSGIVEAAVGMYQDNDGGQPHRLPRDKRPSRGLFFPIRPTAALAVLIDPAANPWLLPFAAIKPDLDALLPEHFCLRAFLPLPKHRDALVWHQLGFWQEEPKPGGTVFVRHLTREQRSALQAGEAVTFHDTDRPTGDPLRQALEAIRQSGIIKPGAVAAKLNERGVPHPDRGVGGWTAQGARAVAKRLGRSLTPRGENG